MSFNNTTIHTPPVVSHGYRDDDGNAHVLSSSPVMSHKALGSDDTDYDDSTTPELVEKKRKYSAKLYTWTQEMWENARKDIERRSSVSSSESTDPMSDSSSANPSPGIKQQPQEAPVR